ncbi:MAG: DUF993 family protein [bacterium]
MTVDLPGSDGHSEPFELIPPPALAAESGKTGFSRLAFAATHVVAKAPLDGGAAGAGAGNEPAAGAAELSPEAIDWEATLEFRRHLWGLGFGVAEAMDTAQRELLGWQVSARLIELTLAEARAEPGRMVIAGAGVDHLPPGRPTIAQLIDGYLHQIEFIHQRGGRAIIFPTAHLSRHYPEPRHFVEVYRQVARQAAKPVLVHWLGEMFAPALKGYFPGESFWRIMEDNPNLLGVKVSLLDQGREESIRRRLATQGQVVFSGDDFNFPPLIRGDEQRLLAETPFEFEGRRFAMGDYSHALLGIFDGIAPVAAQALRCLAAGRTEEYEALLAPTVPLSRHIFGAPTQHYKAGLVFLAYLNGHQHHCHLLGDLERERSQEHYVELFKLANAAGVLDEPEAAYGRLLAMLQHPLPRPTP